MVCIARTVRAGCETGFERALHELVQRSLSLPGQLGVHIMRPAPGTGSREYGVVRTPASRAALEDFRTSPLYPENHTAPGGALLTWVVMPLLTRLLRRRLHPVG
jgi:antibiotic biosynthesis monooxygenase (ABM) superfamily enzyme